MKGIAIEAGGWLLVLVGLALLVLPGPGVPVLFAGLTVLAPRYHWARRSIAWMRTRWAHLSGRWHAKHAAGQTPPGPPA